MAVHVIKGSGPPSDSAQSLGMHYIDEDNNDHYLSISQGSGAGDWILVGSGAGGATSFLGLTDTPSTYSTQQNKFVRVNPVATGLLFEDTTFLANIDTPVTYSGEGGKVVKVRLDQTGLEFVPEGAASLPPGGALDDLLQKDSATDGDASFRSLTTNAVWVSLDTKVSDNTLNIATNTTNISSNEGRITTNETNIGTNTTNISSIDGRVTINEGDISTLQTDVGSNTSDIADLQNDKEDKLNKGAFNGYAPLDSSARVPDVNLPTNIQFKEDKSQANGYPSLDAGARVPKVELPTDTVYTGDLPPSIETIPMHNVVYVDGNNGDDTLDLNRGNIENPFATIKAAVDYVALQGPGANNDWAVRIQPSQYVEANPIVIPNNTGLFGIDVLKARVSAQDPNQPLFVFNTFNNIDKLNIEAPANSIGVDIPFCAAHTITNSLISQGQVGVNIQAGAGTSVDIFLGTVNIGQLGPIQTAIQLAGGANMHCVALFCESVGTKIFDISSGSSLDITGGLLSKASEGITVDSANVKIGDFSFLECPNGIVATNNCRLEIANTKFTAGSSGSFPFVVGIDARSGSIVECDGCDFTGYNLGINCDNSTVTISDSSFALPDVGGAFGVKEVGNSILTCRDCFFRVDDNVNFPTAIDIDNTSSGAISECIFLNFKFGIIAKLNSKVRMDDCVIELESGVDRSGTGGIVATNDSTVRVNVSSFNVESGALSQDNATLIMTNVSFTGSTNEFVQTGAGEIIVNNSVFNEDFISVEDWTKVGGTYLSSKSLDTSLIVLDKLKVGTPEEGQITSLGQGATFTRGILVYEYNSQTDTYTDRSIDAQDPGGPPIAFPSVEPNSAIYVSHTLVDGAGEPFPFSGVWLNFTTFGDVGNGEIVSEIWAGSSWQEIQDMLTQAEAPFNQIPRGDTQDLPEGKYNLRFDDRADNAWQKSDPIVPPLGTERFWYRFRIKGNWFNLAWQKRIKFTAQASAVSGVHNNLPIKIDLSLLDAAFWTDVNDDGSDIRITDATGANQLAAEVSTFNISARTGEVWFLSGTLSNAVDTDYFIYYQNPDATLPISNSEFGDSQVWQAYISVYHMNEAAGNLVTVLDASKIPTINNATIEGTSITNGTDGPLEKFYNFAGVDTDSINVGTDPTIISPVGQFSIQCVFRTSGGNDKQRLISIASINTGPTDEDNFGLYIEGGTVRASVTSAKIMDSLIAVEDGLWHSAILTSDGNIAGLYVDGTLRTTIGGIGGLTPTTFPARIGNRGSLVGSFSFTGDIDEVRILDALIFPEQATTEAANVFFQNLFYVFNLPETQAQAAGTGGDPIVSSPAIDQIKIHPRGFTEISEDGFMQHFGTARPILPLFTDLSLFTQTATTGNPPQTGGLELWQTQSQGLDGSFIFLKMSEPA